MKNYSAKDVEAYIASMGKEAQPHLKELRKVIKAAVPKAEESISWGIPFYKYCGMLAGFATFKEHVSFGFAATLQSEDRELLAQKGYKTGSKTLQIRFDQKLPVTIIKQMLKARAKMNGVKKNLKK
jgi:uncharacterized protein YdhG (YjbR/CyaY superfamily)